MSQQGHGGVHPGHVAVVVGTKDVHQEVGPAELVPVIGHVGHQIGGLTVPLDQHPVLVVAILAAPQPDSAVLLVHGAGDP